MVSYITLRIGIALSDTVLTMTSRDRISDHVRQTVIKFEHTSPSRPVCAQHLLTQHGSS